MGTPLGFGGTFKLTGAIEIETISVRLLNPQKIEDGSDTRDGQVAPNGKGKVH